MRVEIDDAKCLAMRRAGKTLEDIALRCEASVMTVWRAVQRAREAERNADRDRRAKAGETRKPRFSLTPTYPANFACDPAPPCPHRGDIPTGRKIYCEQCGKSGMDHHPDLQRSSLTDPRLETKPKAAAKPKPTRKQRRKAVAA